MSELLRAALMVCMDEDLDYGPGVVALGSAGTMITSIGGGRQDLYPDHQRMMIANTRRAVAYGMSMVASEMNVPLYSTSHTGCGAGKAQGIEGQTDLIASTQQVSADMGVTFLGHIPHASSPINLGGGICAHIGRPENQHVHWARRIVMTTGGGITEAELQQFEADGHGDAFVVSADWINYALVAGLIAPQQVLEWLRFHVDLADGIADGVAKWSSVRVYDAGRLSPELISLNESYVRSQM